MPGLSGKETYEEIKKINPDVKVLLIPGFEKDIRIQDTIDLGVKCFLPKPYDINSLAKLVKECFINDKEIDNPANIVNLYLNQG